MGELDNLDVKAMKKFEEDFKTSIAENRTKLVDALWMAYVNKKGAPGSFDHALCSASPRQVLLAATSAATSSRML